MQGQVADPLNAVCSQEAGQAQSGGPPDCVPSLGIKPGFSPGPTTDLHVTLGKLIKLSKT